MPGFRKGHTPVAVVRTRFKKEIRGEVLQKVVPAVVNRAIEENGLIVIGEPELHLDNAGLDKFGQEPFSLHAHVEVLPDVELGEYKGLSAARRTRPVTEETVARVIEDLRESSASLQPVEDRARLERVRRGDIEIQWLERRLSELTGSKPIAPPGATARAPATTSPRRSGASCGTAR